MDRKILMIMVSLLVVAALVVGFVMIASGGLSRAGGFTVLYNKLQFSGDETYHQHLALPTSWHEGDKKTVSDQIVDMKYTKTTISSTTVYVTTLWFVYEGNKWNDPTRGTSFFVPDDSPDGLLPVNNGLFAIDVSSATNLSAKYDIGDVITLQTVLVNNNDVVLAFGDWFVKSTL